MTPDMTAHMRPAMTPKMRPVMTREFALSVGFHLLLALTASLYMPDPSEMLTPDNVLPVEIITIDSFTRLTREQPPVDDAPEITEAKPEPPEKTAKTAPAPPVPPAPATPVADAMPTLDAAKTASAEISESPAPLVNPVPLVRPSTTAPPRKPLLDTSAVLALLDKTPDLPKPETPRAPTEIPEGERMTLSEIDAFRAQIRQCWSVPAGAKNAEQLIVRVRVRLDPTGKPISKEVINRGRLGDRFFLSAAESVLRAIERCQPYQMPPDKYESWQQLELNFDPSKMLGS